MQGPALYLHFIRGLECGMIEGDVQRKECMFCCTGNGGSPLKVEQTLHFLLAFKITERFTKKDKEIYFRITGIIDLSQS